MEEKLERIEKLKEMEIGLIPRNWKLVRLENIACFETGKRMKGGALKSGGAFSIGGEHITDDGNVKFSPLKFISKDFYFKMKKGIVKIGDILICKDGAKAGKTAFVKYLPYQYCAVNEHVFIVRSKNTNKLLNEFLFFYLYSKHGQMQMGKAFHGLIGGITQKDLSELLIFLPPIDEQKKIAYVLSTIQNAKEKTEQIIEVSKALKKSLMKHLFKYGPVPLDEVDKVKLKETEIGLIPEDWDVVSLKEIAEVKYGKAKPKDDGNIPVVGSGGVYSRTSKALVNHPTIVIGRKGTAGKPWLILEPCYPSDTTFYLVLKKAVDLLFIFYFMLLNPLSGEYAKTTLPSLQKPDLENFIIPFPPIEDQKKIAEILSALDRKIEAEENKKKALEELFKSMLHNLMTGKIRVKDLEVS